jgi:FMN phosphatase YigB (HAD superfamily)
MDGVIMKNKQLLHRVAQRSTLFVARELQLRDVLEAEEINRHLYKNFGHTLLGLQKVYNKSSTVQDFSDFVYDADTMYMLENTSMKDSETCKALEQLNNIIQKGHSQGSYNFNVGILSNAPHQWCSTILNHGLVDGIPKDFVFGCDHDIFGNNVYNLLKPNAVMYQIVYDFLSNVLHDDTMKVVFIDDSFVNLIPIIRDPRWYAVHVNPMGPHIRGTNLLTIPDIHFINTMM